MLWLESSENLEFAGFIRYPRIAIDQGAFAFMVGESGCGKSSYLRLVNGTAVPTAGEVFIGGRPAASYSPVMRRKLALLVPQEVYLPEGSVREGFRFYYEARGSACPDDQAIRDALAVCCAGDLAIDALCEELSGGERQRVFQAILLSLPEWKLLLLDEPTAALDEATEARFFGNVRSLCRDRGATALVVSHSVAAARRYATDILELPPAHARDDADELPGSLAATAGGNAGGGAR